MFIVWADVVSHAPQLSGTDATVQTDILAYVNETLVTGFFDGEDGITTRLARIYLAAHSATAASLAVSGNAGPVASETLGSESRSYASLSLDNILARTGYGVQFMRLLNNSAARGPFVL